MRLRYTLLCLGLTLGWTLACSGIRSDDPPEPERDEAPERAEEPGEAAPVPVGKAAWSIAGEPVNSRDQFVGAVMDLWAGDPGVICFTGDADPAAKRAGKAFKDSDNFVSSKAADGEVVITTTSPFGDGEESGSTFSPCP